MNVKLNHTEYSGVELQGESLFVHLQSGSKRELQSRVKDYAVTVMEQSVHLVVFLLDGTVWHFYGPGELKQERLEIGGPYGRGSLLIADAHGRLHLLYLTVQSKGFGSILRHQIYSGEWSKPILVSTNVFGGSGDTFSAAWGVDGYLHLAYCSYGDGHLYYRVFHPEQGVWSGAVPFSKTRCHQPQFLHTSILCLVWIEEERFSVVKIMLKRESWSKPTIISRPETHGVNVGFCIIPSEVDVLWMQGNEMFKVSLYDLADVTSVDRDGYEYVWTVVKSENGSAMILPVYKPLNQEEVKEVRKIEESEAEEPEIRESEPEKLEVEIPVPMGTEAEAKQMETRLQDALIEKAFRIQQEWEELREEYGYLRMEIGALRREMANWKASLEIPDLNPMHVRLERLERRLLTSLKSKEQQEQNIVQRLGNLEAASAAVKSRRKERPSGWRRVF